MPLLSSTLRINENNIKQPSQHEAYQRKIYLHFIFNPEPHGKNYRLSIGLSFDVLTFGKC